jgi:hypothetical protein
MLTPASVTSPEMIGVIVWWSVVLAGPVLLVRRRREAGPRRLRNERRGYRDRPGHDGASRHGHGA